MPKATNKQRTRKLTPLIQGFYDEARKLGLPNALGRAVFLANRRYNGDWHYVGVPCLANRIIPALGPTRITLAGIQPSTARRWEAHWKAGGAVKTLRRTRAQESARRKAYDDRIRANVRINTEWALTHRR